MKTVRFHFALTIAFLACPAILPVFCRVAEADIVMTATETDGGDVLFSYSGSLDINGLANPFASSGTSSFVDPGGGTVSFGNGSPVTFYDPGATPGFFGSGFFTSADVSNTGDAFGVGPSTIALPEGYTGFNPDSSVHVLSGAMLFSGATFDSLEMTPGTYVWNNISSTETVTLSITSVPEPSCIGFFAIGISTLLLRRKRIRRAD